MIEHTHYAAEEERMVRLAATYDVANGYVVCSMLMPMKAAEQIIALRSFGVAKGAHEMHLHCLVDLPKDAKPITAIEQTANGFIEIDYTRALKW